ncbi:hypothetical protein G6L97_04295 [Agrobacterium tumefaciens]|uniref:hypothetical protein n=1 Tax=Agrobacterium tumefaciens TaxID=358 RepID=UPI0012301541|nr:hypothetical protein [Agrobacterium tumefaciens]KAA3531426.1 hypothetical protein DXM29_05570 [Agrobacterium tumefaciens]NSZ83631.1 hypothetical protein [Agrobacterium tumefaciens]WCA69840.1 hypothetical protein G6L97_04295 [Agrobacterium tumefaciens]
MVEFHFDAELFESVADPAQHVRNLWHGLDGAVVKDLPSRIALAAVPGHGYDDLMAWAKEHQHELDDACKAAIFDVIMRGRPTVKSSHGQRDYKLRYIAWVLRSQHSMTWSQAVHLLKNTVARELSEATISDVVRGKR